MDGAGHWVGRIHHRLAPTCLLYPGHEYSEMLLTMAVRREPHNEAAKTKLVEVRARRKRQEPSIPSTLAEEREYNAYLRATPLELADMCGAVDMSEQ